MIHLVTLNPALDLELELREAEQGKIGDVVGSDIQAGGKAINVARFLKKTKIPFTAWLGTGGGVHPTHVLYNSLLAKEGIKVRFLSAQAPVRWNVVVGLGNGRKKYNHPGFELDLDFFGRLQQSLHKGDHIVLTGRLPQGMNDSLYASWVTAFNRKGVLTIVDSSGKPLRKVLEAKPWFFKVNRQELLEAFGQKNAGLSAVLRLKRGPLAKMGLTHGAVTDGADGALVWDEKETLRVRYTGKPVKGFVVGAGDGFLAGYLRGVQLKKSLKDRALLACATATAVAQSGIMDFSIKSIKNLKKKIIVKKV